MPGYLAALMKRKKKMKGQGVDKEKKCEEIVTIQDNMVINP